MFALGVLLINHNHVVAYGDVQPTAYDDNSLNGEIVVTNAALDQKNQEITSDGAGGSIIVWQDNRNGNLDIYAQRISSNGSALWSENGVPITMASGKQSFPSVISDDSGGAIIAWQDTRGGTSSRVDIYAQRVDANGSVKWTSNGVAISTAADDQYAPQIVSDGKAGAIIVWYDFRSGNNYDIYAQRVNASGSVQWANDGLAITTAYSHQNNPSIVGDGYGGAIIAWNDSRNGNYDIYAQKVDASGTQHWTANGLAVSTANNDQTFPDVASDVFGNAIISWQDTRNGYADIYAQKVDANGIARWTTNGVVVSAAPNVQSKSRIVNSGNTGAIIIWEDYRNGNTDIFAQKLNGRGVSQWAGDGLAISTAAGAQSVPDVISDNLGGVVIAWQDYRNGSSNYDIYSQRVNTDGVVQWTADGIVVSAASGSQFNPKLILNGAGRAMITWEDYSAGNYDIYAKILVTKRRISKLEANPLIKNGWGK